MFTERSEKSRRNYAWEIACMFWLMQFSMGCGVLSSTVNREQKYTAYKINTPIKIDGILDDAAWRGAAPSPQFLDPVKATQSTFHTEAKILWDEKNLYVSFRISDPNVWATNIFHDYPLPNHQLPETFLLEKREFKENLKYTENFIKVYLDPDRDGKNYTEMHVNPLNAVFDKWQETPFRKDVCKRINIKYPDDGVIKTHPEWNCPGLKTAVHTYGTLNDPYDVDRGWTAEMAIPFESLKHLSTASSFPPKAGDLWKIYLARRYVQIPGAEASYQTWPSPGDIDCHIPDLWGNLEFANSRIILSDAAKADDALPELKISPKKDPINFAEMPKGDFKWKALWVRPVKSHKEADDVIALTKNMNCNVIILYTAGARLAAYESKFLETEKGVEKDTIKHLIDRAHKNNIKVHAWFVCHVTGKEFAFKHPEMLQQVRAWETENEKLPRTNPDRENLQWGTWLCPDRGVSDLEKNIIREIFRNFDFDGFAFDYVGYRNYYACFCDYSIKKRQEFANKHSDLSTTEIMRLFSEESMLSYMTEIRELVKSLKPTAEFSMHIYPDFDPSPVYGNRLPVEYCGQTIGWFPKPFWSYAKVYETCMKFKNAEGKFVKYNKFVPFIGVYSGDMLKTPERLRTEIRIAALAGNGTIMFAMHETFMKQSELVNVVQEELNSSPQ